MVQFRDMIKTKKVNENEIIKFIKSVGINKIKEALKELEGTKKEIKEELSIVDYIRDIGFKIKKEEPNKDGYTLEFYREKDAQAAYEEVLTLGTKETISLNGKYLIISF